MAKQAYIQANTDWLTNKAKEEGVHLLAKGMFYKVVKASSTNGRHPDRRSIVTVHYTGRTINGKEFDSSLGGVAPAFRITGLIEGWIIALQQMVVGDKWELYIPTELGYGRLTQPGIPDGSTLIFEIELLGIA